ncbi:sensor histidine kinase [Nonomuraea sediminis]|uniref:sensor histidine kinase n=1 Tax=Nonomuraea sediminis TaxID=2835864 RepID=UPI0027E15CA9|nr:histidine kinase [Nonomuraea sediminis]
MSGLLQRLRALPPAAVDLAITLGVLIGLSVPFLYARRMSGPEPWTLAEYWPVLVGSVPLLLRRRYPLAVFVVVAAASVAYSLRDPDVPPQPVPYGWLAGLFTVAELSPRWKRLLAVGISLAPAVTVSPSTFVRSTLTAVAAYAMGRAVVKHRENAALMAERAAERERARIARDMHDILAHAISIMIVQAEAGPFAVRGSPERAIQAFRAISEAGRDAQAQLRRMLDLLKDGEMGREPQPTLTGVPDLVARVSATGPQVRLAVTGTAATLPADAELAAYRIVQEALTNMVKHARATTGEVRLDWKDGELMITISDDGRGPGGHGAGHGLVGMRERAAACGGTVTYGGGPGGFQVEARLPL